MHVARACAAGCLCLMSLLTPARTRAEPRLRWDDSYRRVGTFEYVFGPSLLVGSLAVRLLVPPTREAYWARPVWFDASVQRSLRARTDAGRRRAAIASDALALVSILQPVVIDSVFVAGIEAKSPDVAEQMEVINIQSYGLTVFANTIAKRAFARERPYGAACARNPGHTEACENLDRFRSFYSGHSAVTATGSGLVCAHHTHLELYGGGAPDVAACVVALTGTLATGTLRIVSDRHWATDVIAGHLIGFASGYLLPTLVYYGGVKAHPESSSQGTAALAQRPLFVLSGTF